MTQEHKDLLLKDLCARLPYGVKVQAFRRHSEEDPTIIGYPYTLDFIMMSIMFKDNIEEYKPYLFPVSSMTEEQMDELLRLRNQQYFVMREYTGTYKDSIPHCIGERNVIDWLNKNHFDYRGLIPMGLAIDATGLNVY